MVYGENVTSNEIEFSYILIPFMKCSLLQKQPNYLYLLLANWCFFLCCVLNRLIFRDTAFLELIASI